MNNLYVTWQQKFSWATKVLFRHYCNVAQFTVGASYIKCRLVALEVQTEFLCRNTTTNNSYLIN